MGKLIGYELRKQRTSRMVILILLAVGVLVFLWGILFKNDTTAGIALVLMFCSSMLVLLYTGIESILVLNRDLKTKQSYMLWMVPKSVWEIFGAKFISAILQMLFVFALYFAAGCICLLAAIYTAGGISELVDAIKMILEIAAEANLQDILSWSDIIWLAISIFLSWTEVIMIGFLAVVLSRTVLINSKYAGLVSVILFFVINWVIERGWSLIDSIPAIHEAGSFTLGYSGWYLMYYLVISAVLFGATGWMADRKLSV